VNEACVYVWVVKSRGSGGSTQQGAVSDLLLTLSSSDCLRTQIVDVLLDAVADVAEKLRRTASNDDDDEESLPAACQLENVGYVLDCIERVLTAADAVAVAGTGGVAAANGVATANNGPLATGLTAANGVVPANGVASAANNASFAAYGGFTAASGVASAANDSLTAANNISSAADGGGGGGATVAAQLRRRLSSQLDVCLRHVAGAFPLFAYRVWQLAALVDARQR